MSSLSTSCSLKEVLGEFGSDVVKEVVMYEMISSLGTFASSLFCFGHWCCGLKGDSRLFFPLAWLGKGGKTTESSCVGERGLSLTEGVNFYKQKRLENVFMLGREHRERERDTMLEIS